MNLYAHTALAMPTSGKDVSAIDQYWSFNEGCWMHEDSDVDLSLNYDEMYLLARTVINDPAGAWTLSYDDEHVCGELVKYLGRDVTKKLPRHWDWWKLFAQLLQLVDDNGVAWCASMAYDLNEGHDLEYVVENDYNDFWEEWGKDKDILKECLATHHLDTSVVDGLSNAACVELFDDLLSERFDLFEFHGAWYARDLDT